MTTALQVIEAQAGEAPISLGIILGSGLGGLTDDVDNAVTIPFADIPGFPVSTVSGHAGALNIGEIAGRRVALVSGRAHYYEGGGAGVMRPVVETLHDMGAGALFLSNAAGSTRPEIGPGSLVVLRDHINFRGADPLIGEPSDARFVNLLNAYSPRLRALIRDVDPVPEGVYAWFSGPSFETPAEIDAVRMLGADLVGMSTVPECILARFFGMEVAAVSVVTNLAAGMAAHGPSHAETKREAALAEARFRALVRAFVAGYEPADKGQEVNA